MDFIDTIRQFSNRVESLYEKIKSEEATKTSLVMPFFTVLGYDVFNPEEFVPEFTADVGIKKGEKVDYAIKIDDKPAILVEVKWCGEPLDKHASQLFRYFATTDAKFGILTNGLIYNFYTDLNEQNKMDLEPFLVFDILNIDENNVTELKRFARQTLDIDAAFNAAQELRHMNKIKDTLNAIRKDTPDSFIKYMMDEIGAGLKNQKAIDKFRPIIKRGFNQYIKDSINETLKNAMNSQPETTNPDNLSESLPDDISQQESHDAEIVSTLEELEAYAIVKSILRDMVDVNRLSYKHTSSYKVILFDNNSRKRICRLWLKGKNIHITTPDKDMKPVRHDIENLNDIYKYSDFIREVCSRYL